jgi:hypothetical protein
MNGLMIALATSLLVTLTAVPAAHGDEVVSVGGRVTYTGTVPAVRKLLISKDPELCGHGYREIQDIKVDEAGHLSEVVVYLDSTELEFTWEHPEEGYTLNQKGCRFEPNIQIFPKDFRAKLRIVNSDPTLHNVRISQILGRVKPTLLNLAQPEGMAPKEKALRTKKGSNAIEIKCDAHDFMEGWMFAADNPYCALVKTDGTYQIANVPAGEYTFKAWHPHLGTISEKAVVISDGKMVELNFEFSAEGSEK